MSRPLIGVSAGEIFNRERPWGPVTYGQSYTYIDSIIRAGGIPVIIPLTTDTKVIDEISKRLDGLLLCGGNDIHPNLYKENPYDNLDELSELRDSTELRLLENALKDKIPILGICRGMQLINVRNGGTLYQHLAVDKPGGLNHESSTEAQNLEDKAHIIKVEPGSKLAGILGETGIETNTHHHQAIKDLGKHLKVTARASDGIIEAIETEDDRYIICVQSHPESLGRVIPTWQKLFKSFVDAAKNLPSRQSFAGT